MGSQLRAAAAAAGLIALAGPAEAAVFMATFKGLVHSGTDHAGVFGAAGGLAGEAFTAVFFIDDQTPGASINQEPGSSSIAGSEPSVPVTASLTINGVTRSYGQQHGSTAAVDASVLNYDYVSYYVEDYVEAQGPGEACGNLYCLIENRLDLYASSTVDDFTTGDFRDPITYALGANTLMAGSFFEYRINDIPGVGVVKAYLVEGELSPTSLTVQRLQEPGGAVPEPATWAMLILGFGGVGALARRARDGALMNRGARLRSAW